MRECVCAPAFTVCSLNVLPDGFSLIFYLVLQETKLELGDMLPLQLKREREEKKIIKGSLREGLTVEKNGPKYCLALLKRQIQKIHLKAISPLPLPVVSKIYDLCVKVGQAVRRP